MMIAQPAFVPAELIAHAIDEVRAKKNPPALARLRLESFKEGRCAQILHVGPFSEEGRERSRNCTSTSPGTAKCAASTMRSI